MSRRSLIVLASVVIALATSAVAAGSGGKKAQAPQLKGTWLTAVALTNPPPGVDATFQALDTFVPGGGILVSSSQSHPVARSLAHGTCAHAQGQDFTCTFVWFRFDPVTGVFAGSQRV